MQVFNDVYHTTLAQVSVRARHVITIVIHDVRLIDRLFSLSVFLALFLSVCLSCTLLFSSLFYLYSVLNLFFYVDNAKANNHCASPQRSIEQNLRVKNFEARNGNYETNAVVKNQGTKQREQRSPGDCWQWKANGQCSKGDNCSFRYDTNKRGKSTQPNPSPSSSTR